MSGIPFYRQLECACGRAARMLSPLCVYPIEMSIFVQAMQGDCERPNSLAGATDKSIQVRNFRNRGISRGPGVAVLSHIGGSRRPRGRAKKRRREIS